MSDGSALRIGPMTPTDWHAVHQIYVQGIATGNATLEREAPDWDHFDRSHRQDCRLVARDRSDDPGGLDGSDGPVLGWVAVSAVSARRVYRGVAWESVYVAESARGRGVGRALLLALIAETEAAGFWTVQAGVLADNLASLALHERVGFRRVGVQHRLGQDRTGRWRDVVLLERRSETVGSDDDPV